MIPKFKTYLEESIWRDIRKKSLGQETRIENDVNNMDMEQFFEYIMNHYETTTNEENIGHGRFYIRIPLFFSYGAKKMPRKILWDIRNKTIEIREPIFARWPESLKKLIYDNYVVTSTLNLNKDKMCYVTRKDGETNNDFLLEVIDNLLQNIEHPILKKKMNESVWGDIRKKSLGKEERIEDIVNTNHLNSHEMIEYLEDRYECTKEEPRYPERITYVGGAGFCDVDVPLYTSCTLRIRYKLKKDDNIDNIKLLIHFTWDIPQDQKKRNDKLTEEFNKRYKVTYADGYYYIRPLKGKVTNNLAVDLIDFVLNFTEDTPYIRRRRR